MFGKILLNPSVDKRQNHKADNYKSQYIIKQNKGRLCNTNSASDYISFEGYLRPPVLRWLGRGILVPLQAEISGSDPKMIYNHLQSYNDLRPVLEKEKKLW